MSVPLTCWWLMWGTLCEGGECCTGRVVEGSAGRSDRMGGEREKERERERDKRKTCCNWKWKDRLWVLKPCEHTNLLVSDPLALPERPWVVPRGWRGVSECRSPHWRWDGGTCARQSHHWPTCLSHSPYPETSYKEKEKKRETILLTNVEQLPHIRCMYMYIQSLRQGKGRQIRTKTMYM